MHFRHRAETSAYLNWRIYDNQCPVSQKQPMTDCGLSRHHTNVTCFSLASLKPTMIQAPR
jgi:hypothetical protein